MGFVLVTPPAVEPITLDEACAQCRIDQDAESGLIAGYILAARHFAENFTRLALLQQTYDVTVDFTWPFVRVESPAYAIWPYYFYRYRMEFPRRPVIGVQWIHYIDINGAQQTLDPTQYVLLKNEPDPYIEPAFGVTLPVVQYQPAAIQFRFDAGYGTAPSDIPEPIRQAMLMLIAFWYDNRGSAQFGARARAAESGAVTSSIMPAEIPPGVIALLSSYALPRMIA